MEPSKDRDNGNGNGSFLVYDVKRTSLYTVAPIPIIFTKTQKLFQKPQEFLDMFSNLVRGIRNLLFERFVSRLIHDIISQLL